MPFRTPTFQDFSRSHVNTGVKQNGLVHECMCTRGSFCFSHLLSGLQGQQRTCSVQAQHCGILHVNLM